MARRAGNAVVLMLPLRHLNTGCSSVQERDAITEKLKTAYERSHLVREPDQ